MYKMKLTTILAVSIIVCYVKQKYILSQSILFPEDLKKWCPHTTFCDDGDNKSQADHLPSNEGDLIPCCSSCSCAEDCGRKRNCCRYEYDLYRLEETLGTVCKQLNTLRDNVVRDEPFYHVIDKCPNRLETCISQNESVSSSYSPVYSRDSGMLYYNKKCAMCHKQKKTIDLYPVVGCGKLTVSYFPSFSALLNGTTTSDCVLRFLIPEDIDISTEICYPLFTRACSPQNPSYEIYSDACQYFNATFRTHHRTNYKNVYCYLCISKSEVQHSHWMKANELCPVYENRKSVLQSVMFMLLFEKPLSEEKESYDLQYGEENLPIWCLDTAKKLSCRPIYCPEGQDFYKGSCRYVGDRWRFKYFRMNVKLVLPTETKFTVDDLDISSDPSTNNVTLERPGFQDYRVAVLYDQGINGSYIRHFVAMLSKKFLVVVPRQLIEKTKKSFSSKWILHMNKRVILLKPEFHENIWYEPLTMDEDTIFHEPLSSDGGTVVNNLRKKVLHLIFADFPLNTLKERLEPVFLTKLFICDVVELEQHEVQSYSPLLLLVNQSRFLQSGEYERKFDELGSLKARICLSDLRGYSNSSKLKLSSTSIFLFVNVAAFKLIGYFL